MQYLLSKKKKKAKKKHKQKIDDDELHILAREHRKQKKREKKLREARACLAAEASHENKSSENGKLSPENQTPIQEELFFPQSINHTPEDQTSLRYSVSAEDAIKTDTSFKRSASEFTLRKFTRSTQLLISYDSPTQTRHFLSAHRRGAEAEATPPAISDTDNLEKETG